MRRHAIRAFVIAPLVAPIIAFALFSLSASTFDKLLGTQFLALGIAVVVAIVSYAHAFVLGLPLALLLLRRGIPSIAASALCGALVGALPVSIAVATYELAAPLDDKYAASRVSSSLVEIAICAACGMLSGIVWWLKVDGALFRERFDAA